MQFNHIHKQTKTYVKYQTKPYLKDLETFFKENTSLVLKSFMCGRKTDQETR